MKITPQALKLLREEMRAALQAIGDKHGVQFSIGGIKYTDENFTAKVTASNVASDGLVATPEATAFKQLATLYGLKPEHLGKSFQYGGETYTIVGLRANAHKRPILTTNGKKNIVFPADAVARLLPPETPTA